MTVKQFLIKNAGLLTLMRMSQALLNIARRCCHWLEIKNKTFLSSLRPLRRKNEYEGFLGWNRSFTALEVLLIKTHFCLWVFESAHWVYFIFHHILYDKWELQTNDRNIVCSKPKGSIVQSTKKLKMLILSSFLWHCPPFSKLLCWTIIIPVEQAEISEESLQSSWQCIDSNHKISQWNWKYFKFFLSHV